MLSKIIIRIIPMLLVFVSAAFAAAPGWVAKGVVLDYSVDGDTVTFTVTGRTSTEVKIDIKTTTTHKATENASLNYGQFWFDDSLLEDASKGDEIDEFKVTAAGTQTFAGKQWDTVTLEATISGAKTTRIYDKDSGLMLKQTVQAADAPAVTLTKYTVPNFGAVAPAAPQPTTQAAQPSQPGTQPTSQPPQPDPEDSEEQPQLTAAAGEENSKATKAEEETGKPCFASIMLLVLAGLVFVKS